MHFLSSIASGSCSQPLLVVCLFILASAIGIRADDAGTCAVGNEVQGACVVTGEVERYEAICRQSFDEIQELEQLMQSGEVAFLPRAWAWIEAAGKCLYAIQKKGLSAPASSSAATLQRHITDVLRTVLSADKILLSPPAGACKKLVWKKKNLVKVFRATINGGVHPELKLKVFTRHKHAA